MAFKTYQVVAAVTTYCYHNIEAPSPEEASRVTQELLDADMLDGGDFYTMEQEERPGKFEIIEANPIS